MNKKLSFIILTYNSENDIRDCLDSLLENFNAQEAEIIIWDNNSKDKTREILENYKKFNFIKIILNESNIGFALGNNEASKYSNSKYICLLNADTVSDYNSFKEILNYMDKNENIGVVGPKCLSENKVIQESYGYFPSLLREIIGKFLMSLYLEKIPLIKFLKNRILYKNKPKEVDWVSGACTVIRKDLWDKLGGLDITYFFSNGDMIDFCYRAYRLGFKVVYYPLVSIIHKGSRSVTKDLNSRILGLKNGYLGTLYLFKQHGKNIFYIYLTKISFIIISLIKGSLGIVLAIFNKKFKDLALSHFIVSFWLLRNFFNNNFKELCGVR